MLGQQGKEATHTKGAQPALTACNAVHSPADQPTAQPHLRREGRPPMRPRLSSRLACSTWRTGRQDNGH